MKAIVLNGFGPIDNLVISELPAPRIAGGEVLVQVKAISINPVDVKTRIGKGLAAKLKDDHPIIIGWDIAGIVTGSVSPLFKTGDEVFGMINFPGHGRAYAEYVAAPAGQLALKPANTNYEDAAAATLAALTAWQNLTRHTRINPGQRVLIHAVAGGVGHYAVQMAKYFGAYVIGTASAANKQFALGLGVDEFIDYKTQRFEEATGNIDLVLDTIGGENIDRSLLVIKKGGTIISIPSGLNEAVKEKAQARGINGFSTMVQSNGEDMMAIAGLLKDGSIKSHVSQVFSFEEMGKAHLQVESGKTRGKVVVKV